MSDNREALCTAEPTSKTGYHKSSRKQASSPTLSQRWVNQRVHPSKQGENEAKYRQGPNFQVCDLALPSADKCKTLHTRPNEMLAMRAPWGRGQELLQRGHAGLACHGFRTSPGSHLFTGFHTNACGNRNKNRKASTAGEKPASVRETRTLGQECTDCTHSNTDETGRGAKAELREPSWGSLL